MGEEGGGRREGRGDGGGREDGGVEVWAVAAGARQRSPGGCWPISR